MFLRIFTALLFFITSSFNFVLGQSQKNIKIHFDKSNVIGHHSVLINKSLVKTGLFSKQLNISTSNKYGLLEIFIYPEGYQSISILFKLDTLVQKTEIKLDLVEKSIKLEDVIITAKRNRFSNFGDTINVHIDDIQTTPHSEASELFDRIEGFEAKENGTFTALGKNVEIVTIDSKRIFGGNPQLTLANINSDMIKSIQIVNRKTSDVNRGVQINIKLKENRKKGSFGKIGFGYGLKNSFDYNLKYNKLFETGISANFGQGNNTTIFSIKPIFDNEIVEDFYTKNSIFGYKSIDNNLAKYDETEENTNNGINKFHRMGSSYSSDKKNISHTFNLLINNENTQIESSVLSNTFLDNRTIKAINTNFSLKNLNTLTSNYGVKLMLKKNISLIYKAEFNKNVLKKTQYDSTRITEDTQYTERNVYLNKARNNNLIKMDFGITKSNTLRKSRLTICSNLVLFNENNKNLIDFSSFEALQNYNNFKLSSEIIQSYPLFKKILIEQRMSYIYNFGNFKNKYLSETSNQINQNSFQLENQAYYQNKNYILKTNFAFIHIPSYIKKNNSQTFYTLKKVNLRFPKNQILSNFDFDFENDLILPDIRDRLVIPDSADIFARFLSNQNLRPYFQKKIAISYSNMNFQVSNISSSINIGSSSNAFQTETFWEDNYLFTSRFVNVNSNLMSISGNTYINLKKVPKKTEFNLTHFFLISEAISFLNGNKYEGVRKFHNFVIQTNYRKSSNLNIKNSLILNYNFFLETHTRIYENNSKLQFKIGKNIYSKVSNRLFFGPSLPFQQIFNFDVNRFFLQNKINIEFQAVNLLNFKSTTTISQNLNQQIQSQITGIPRLFLIKFNVFPESWK